jgi:hypothetical protein
MGLDQSSQDLCKPVKILLVSNVFLERRKGLEGIIVEPIHPLDIRVGADYKW